MDREVQQATLTIALLAAFADGANDEREREQIRRLAEDLGAEPGAPDLPGLYSRVLLKRVGLAEAAAVLKDRDQRQLAYEMAVCVCDADGRQTDAERRFLADLAGHLQLAATDTAPVNEAAEAIAAGAETAAGTPVTTQAAIGDAELERSILNHAILTGALELLPQSWASLAIIPLQIKMVYGIGRSHGYELDQGHVRELLATVGVGLTSQYLEQFGRKLIGGLLGKAAGRLAGGLGRAATGVAFSFATTYALGQVARRYYAGGRQMSAELLRQSFAEMLVPAKQLQTRYLPQIEERASRLDMGQVMALVKER